MSPLVLILILILLFGGGGGYYAYGPYGGIGIGGIRPHHSSRVGANWAAVGFAHEVEVTRRGREAHAAMYGDGVGSLLGGRGTARRRAQ